MYFTAYLIAVIFIGCICGAISKAISSGRDMEGGFWWGFCLWIIGIIVVAVRPKDNSTAISNGVPTTPTAAFQTHEKKGVFDLPANLYTEGSPVVISSGTLLKDEQTEGIYAKLTLLNIVSKPIIAATVCLHPMDAAGRPLGEDVSHDYLDLNTPIDGVFGENKLVSLPNTSTREFSVEVRQVIFADKSVWTSENAVWEPIPSPEPVGDTELIKQYQLHFGGKAKYKPQHYKDLWVCACGAINSEKQTICHFCTSKLDELQACDYEELAKEKEERLSIEEAERKEKEKVDKAVAELKAKRTKKHLAIAIPIVLCLAIILGIAISVSAKRATEAKLAQICGNYSHVDEIYSAGYVIGYEKRLLTLKKDYSVVYYYNIHKYVPGYKDTNEFHNGTFTIDFGKKTIKFASSDKTLDGIVLHFTDDGVLYYGSTQYKK